MLVLSRKEGEQIVIANDIVITVTRVGKQRVQLGIRAPGSVHVRRAELPVHPQYAESELAGAGADR
jgi:carbon storage regulator